MTLYHRLADPDCARVRRRITELGLAAQVNFRNVDVSEKALAALKDLVGADQVPCLENEGKVYMGASAILQFLDQSDKVKS